MEGFVTRQNIEHYRSMLQITTDLAVMEKLPREEEAKSKKYDEDHKKKSPASSKTARLRRCLSCRAITVAPLTTHLRE